VDVFEIQVYEGDINQPGQPGLELHTNFVADGRRQAQPGGVAPHHLLRTTLEPSFGVLPWWELGAYLQVGVEAGAGRSHFGGFKLRTKFVVPRDRTGDFVLGLNVELGRGGAAFGDADWDTELRPILVYAPPGWLFAVNPILGWAVTGARRAAPDLEPAAKVRRDTRLGVGFGLEYYAGLGALSAPAAPSAEEHFLYVAADLVDAPFELNLAVGRGLTDATDPWTVKMIVGKAF
jgi:hypothetical protein